LWFTNSLNYYLAVLLFNAFPLPQREAGARQTLRYIGELLADRHSLLIFIIVTGIGWTILFLRMNVDSKWGQVVGNIVSEWVQMAGLVFLTKRLVEIGSKESS